MASTNEPTPDVHESGWREVFYRLRGQPYPLFVFSDQVIAAASVWSGARLWTAAFREAGMHSGDRVVLALPPSAAFIQVLIAALWDGLTVALVPPSVRGSLLEDAMAEVDARAAVSLTGDPERGIWEPVWCEGPSTATIRLRPTRHEPTSGVDFLLKTSGTTDSGKWVALTTSGTLAVLKSHLPRLGMVERESRVLSVLPWHHAFGLVLDLLPALAAGVEIARDPDGGRNPAGLIATGLDMEATHLNAVPLTLKRVLGQACGAQFLRSLQGGIVGGAPVDAELTGFLTQTRLRAGYGQTEASPGITLGEPGYWPAPHYIGRPLGCTTRRDERGILHFAGPNACAGYWNPATGLSALPPERWTDTGDLVREVDNGDFFFEGRADDAFKLANGRRVEAGPLETRLRLTFPQLTEALLWSPDGERLLLSVLRPGDAPLPQLTLLREALGPVGARLDSLDAAPADAWVRTPKGTVQRRATLDRLRAIEVESPR